MVNINTKSLGVKNPVGSPPVNTAGGSAPPSNGGDGSNPGGNTGSGGASASPAPIPGAGSKAKRGLRTEVTQVVSGIGTQFPDGSAIAVNGVFLSKQQLISALVVLLALYADVDAGASALKSKRLALKAAEPGGRALLANIKAAIVAFFGKGNPALAAFGFSLAKPRRLTAEQKLASKEAAKQTRKLRGTLGPRAIQGVKFQGQVQVQTSVSGTQTSGGNTPATSGGNTTGAASTPAPSGNPAPGSGNTGSSAS